MSIQCMVWAMKQQAVADASARHVLVCLANYAGDEGRAAFPSVSTLSVDTGLSERTVRSKLDLLESCGAIVRGNQAIVAAYIERADKRPVCYDIVMALTDKPGAAAAPRSEAPGANGAATGCNPCSHGVQSKHERGAAIAGNPSVKPSTNPSVNPKDSASPSGTPDMFAEPPANSASRADKKPNPEAFDPMAELLDRGVSEEVARDWVQHRKSKRAQVTVRVIDDQASEAAEARLSLEEALRYCVMRNWQSFVASWHPNCKQGAGSAQGGGFPSKQERAEAENARRRAEREASKPQPVEYAAPPPYKIPLQRPALLSNNHHSDDVGF